MVVPLSFFVSGVREVVFPSVVVSLLTLLFTLALVSGTVTVWLMESRLEAGADVTDGASGAAEPPPLIVAFEAVSWPLSCSADPK